MESYKREFIQFLEKAGVLKFGDFTAKSGRKIPYFINAGMIKTGEEIATLGEFYARAYVQKLGDKKTTTWAEAAGLLDQILYSVGTVVSNNRNEYAEKLKVLVRALKNDNMITPNTEKSLLSQFKAIEADAKKGYNDEKDN